jgi:hypothetical protein
MRSTITWLLLLLLLLGAATAAGSKVDQSHAVAIYAQRESSCEHR